MDALIDGEARDALVERIRSEAKALREKPVVIDDAPPVTDDSVRSAARTDVPIPEPPFWGAREVEVDFDQVFPHLDRHVLFKLHWGGRGKKGEEWRKIVEGTARRRASRPAWSGCGASRTTCTRGPSSATSPATPTATSWYLRSRGPAGGGRAACLPAPAEARPHLPHRLLPPAGQRRPGRGGAPGCDRRPRGHRADVEARGRGRVRRAALCPRARGAVGRGPGRVAPLGGPPGAGDRRRARAGATPGATRRARISPSTRRSGGCSASRRSA